MHAVQRFIRPVAKWAFLSFGLTLAACAQGGVIGEDAGRAPVDAGPPGDGGSSCVSASECADDGLVCNGQAACVGGRCVVEAAVDCDDGIGCTIDACNEPDGSCSHAKDPAFCGADQVCDPARGGCVMPLPCETDADCDDNDFCTGVSTCEPSFGCRPGAAPDCSDAFACTSDSCDSSVGAEGACVHEPTHSACDDGLACTGVEACVITDPTADSRGCTAGSTVVCDDSLDCTTDSCTEPTGMCVFAGTDVDMDGVVAVGCAGGMDCDDTNMAVRPGAPELCNGVDDDCDGSFDEASGRDCVFGSPPVSCTTGCGTAGTQDCGSTCNLGACLAATDSCNGCDDDGDGMIDEGFVCAAGMTTTCTTACGSPGSQICDAACGGFTGDCLGTELCNDCDDDGNGMTDEGFDCRIGVSGPCMTACSTPGEQVCTGTCTFGTCEAPAEVCGNGCDDDGDGVIDGGCPPVNALCGRAIALSIGSATVTSTTVATGRETTGCGAGPEVFYSLTLANENLVYLDTLGSASDTAISYLGTACGTATAACAAGSCGMGSSQLVQLLGAGTHYFAVHARDATGGAFSLNYRVARAASGADILLSGTGSYSGSTSGSSSVSASCGNSARSPEEAYYWLQCPSDSRRVVADTCDGTDFDTVLHLVGPSGELTCNDDTLDSFCGAETSDIDAMARGVGLFQLFVDGYGTSQSGNYRLDIDRF